VKAQTFLGAISNSGKIAAHGQYGILVRTVGSFGSDVSGGGITNTGVISGANNGIAVTSVTVFGNASAGGGIVNSGTISAFNTDIRVGATTFSGGISNASSGKIVSTTGRGIFVGSPA